MKPSDGRENREKSLELEKRKELYRIIRTSPGLHFREIQRRTDSGTGQLEYHLEYLMKAGLILSERTGGYLRYYPRAEITPEEKRILALVRQKSVRRILLYLLENESCNLDELVNNLDISSSTISWHLRKIIDAGVVDKVVDGRKTMYSLTDPGLIVEVLIQYRESFMDSMVDRFIEMWEP
jgi:predicted transcriptional regulator